VKQLVVGFSENLLVVAHGDQILLARIGRAGPIRNHDSFKIGVGCRRPRRQASLLLRRSDVNSLVALPNADQLRQGVRVNGIVLGVSNSQATHGHGGNENFLHSESNFKNLGRKSDCNESQMTLPKAKIGQLDDHQ